MTLREHAWNAAGIASVWAYEQVASIPPCHMRTYIKITKSKKWPHRTIMPFEWRQNNMLRPMGQTLCRFISLLYSKAKTFWRVTGPHAVPRTPPLISPLCLLPCTSYEAYKYALLPQTAHGSASFLSEFSPSSGYRKYLIILCVK